MRKVTGKIVDRSIKLKKKQKVPMKTLGSNKKKLSHSGTYSSSPVKSLNTEFKKKKQSRLSQATIDTVFSPETSRVYRSPDLTSRSPDENIDIRHAKRGSQFKKKSEKIPVPTKSIQHYLDVKQRSMKQHNLHSPRVENHQGKKTTAQSTTTPMSSSVAETSRFGNSSAVTTSNCDLNDEVSFNMRETRKSSSVTSGNDSTEEELPRRKTRKASSEVSADETSTMTSHLLSRTEKSSALSSKGRTSTKPSSSQKKKPNEETQVVKTKLKPTLSKKSTKKLTCYMASGDLETHMADKEFIDNQIKLLSKPFHLQGDLLKWFQSWKRKDEIGSTSIPRIAIDNAVRKLNHRLDSCVRSEFTRAQRRFTLQDIDQYRKQLSEDEHSHCGVPKPRLGADIQEALDAYPMEWPNDDDVDDITQEELDDKLERYAAVRSRVFALNRTVIKARKESLNYQSISNLAKTGEDLAKNCDSKAVAHELKRSNALLTQVLEKLTDKNARSSRSKRK